MYHAQLSACIIHPPFHTGGCRVSFPVADVLTIALLHEGTKYIERNRFFRRKFGWRCLFGPTRALNFIPGLQPFSRVEQLWHSWYLGLLLTGKYSSAAKVESSSGSAFSEHRHISSLGHCKWYHYFTESETPKWCKHPGWGNDSHGWCWECCRSGALIIRCHSCELIKCWALISKALIFRGLG